MRRRVHRNGGCCSWRRCGGWRSQHGPQKWGRAVAVTYPLEAVIGGDAGGGVGIQHPRLDRVRRKRLERDTPAFGAEAGRGRSSCRLRISSTFLPKCGTQVVSNRSTAFGSAGTPPVARLHIWRPTGFTATTRQCATSPPRHRPPPPQQAHSLVVEEHHRLIAAHQQSLAIAGEGLLVLQDHAQATRVTRVTLG